jgi:hypothetical protein
MSSRPYSPLQVPARQQTPKATAIKRPEKTALSAVSGKPENLHEVHDYAKVSSMKTFKSASTTGAIQAEQQGPFERLRDPFFGVLNDRLEKNDNNLGNEQACGVACSLKSARQVESFSSGTPKADHSAERQRKSQANHGTGLGALERMAGPK